MTGDLDKWTKDWRRLRHQKHRHRGGVDAAMLLDYLLYHGEHQSIQVQNTILTRAFRHERDKNKLRLIINLARRAADRRIGRLWSIAHRFAATPNTTDPLAFDKADVVGDQLIPALDYKCQQDTLRWNLYQFLVVTGLVFEHCDWKEGVTQEALPKYDEAGNMLWKDELTGMEIPEEQVSLLVNSGGVASERFVPAQEVQTAGDVGSDWYDPFRVFVEASVGQVRKLGADQRIYLADIRSIDWVYDTFGAQAAAQLKPALNLSIIETQLVDRGAPISGMNLKDLLPLVQGGQSKDDPDSVIVLTMYQPQGPRNPKGIRGFFVPEQGILDADDSPYPEEAPIIDYHWSAPGSTMWTTGFMRDLQALSKFINKRYSQLGEAANAQIYEMLLLGGTLEKKDIPTDFPGVVEGGINDDTGLPNVQTVPRGSLPSFFPDSIRMSMETFDTIAGGDLTTQRKFPGQLRGPLAIPMLQEILDSEDGPRFSHLAEQFSREKQMRINRVKEFYPPIRTLTYTGLDLRSEVLEFHADDVLRAGVDYTISIDPGTILPELSSMREARVRERFQWAPGLYTNPRTGTVDWTKLGKDLKYNDRQRESSANRGRKLARQLLRWARQGRISVLEGAPDPTTGKPQAPKLVLDQQRPLIVYPWWEHDAMMDEYTDSMMTTEFIEASPVFIRVMTVLYESSRSVLAQMDMARQQSVENKMVQGAMAQAAAQTAAKSAAVAAEAAIEQVMAMDQTGGPGGGGFQALQDQVRQLLGAAQAQGVAAGAPQSVIGAGQAGRRRLPQLPQGQ